MEVVLSSTINNLDGLLTQELSSLGRFHEELKSLEDELKLIPAFLKDAQVNLEVGEISDATKVWLEQLRENADRINDAIDLCLYHFRQRRQQRPGCACLLRKPGEIVKALKLGRYLASEIRDIKQSLRELKGRGSELSSIGSSPMGLSSSGSTDVATPDECELLGIDSALTTLMTSLVEQQSARTVISLVGEGGIGKTTLARAVYNSVRLHFDCHVWVTVSQSYDIEKILRVMKEVICPTSGQSEEEIVTIDELISLLREFLESKRYVVVFDDVRQTDFWDVIKHAFPNNNNSSRIIVTTRNTRVADSVKENPSDFVHELKPWSSEVAWELFCKNAFREGRCPQELEELSREIVLRCQGRPLVIVAVAGLLSRKEKTKLEWQSMLDHFYDELEKIPRLASVSKDLLFLSFLNLPYYLKNCFLYLGIFPEGYSIIEGRLYRLWISESFIESRTDKTQEQVAKSRRDKTQEQLAKEYLNELIRRGLVSFEISYGIERHCRVHHLIRDFILPRVAELSFCQILEENKLRFNGTSRRLSIYGTTKNVLEIIGDSKMRSLFLFNIDELTESFVVSLFKRFRLLRVLDFEDAPLDHLPREVGNLFHLKYLNLRGTAVKMLPKSIGKLQTLEVLNISQTLIQELPIEINKLQKLQYLLSSYRFNIRESEYGFNSVFGAKMNEGIGCLEELQTLYLVEPCIDGVGFVEELKKLRKLKILGIGKLTAEMGKAFATSFENMRGLEKLHANSINEDEILDLNCISSPPPFLWHVSLQCRMQEFPYWISKLKNLRELNLRFSRLKDDPLKWLKGLPNLVIMNMYKAYDGHELHFEEGGFPSLKQLRLQYLEGMKVMKVDSGALPVLEKFAAGPSPLMKKIPSGIQHLTNLKSLHFINMSREFVVSLQPHVWPDYWKIKRVPSVTFLYGSESYKLGSPELLRHLQEWAN